MINMQADGSYTFRCVLCGARLADLTPPIGTSEIKCGQCGKMNYMSIMPPGGITGYGDVLWIVKTWAECHVRAHGLGPRMPVGT